MNKSLNLLFLAGGLSSRMGTDKGLLQYKSQQLFFDLVHRLKALPLNTFFSIHENQVEKYSNAFQSNLIIDHFDIGGPLNGIFSYYSTQPNSAVLIIPCDMYALDVATVQPLIDAYQNDTHEGKNMYAYAIDGQFEPFPCILTNEALAYCLERFNNKQLEKRSMKYIGELLTQKCIDTPLKKELMNFNTLESLDAFYNSDTQG